MVELTRSFQDRYGRDIVLWFDESSLVCSAHFGDYLIGSLDFREVDDDDSLCLLLVWAHLEEIDGFKHCGIGTALIQMVADYGYRVFCRRNDGNTGREDGSHLTGDAPAFVEALNQKGLISYIN